MLGPVLEPVRELAQLRSKMPKNAKRLITGVKEPVEAWRLLGKRFGDRHILVFLAMHRLQSVKLPQGPAHDKVEAL